MVKYSISEHPTKLVIRGQSEDDNSIWLVNVTFSKEDRETAQMFCDTLNQEVQKVYDQVYLKGRFEVKQEVYNEIGKLF